MTGRPLAALLAVSLVTIAACEEETTGPPRSEVAGTYEATKLLYIQGLDTTDILADGGHIDIVLEEDGSTTGELFIIDVEADSAEFTSDLAGTWRLNGILVRFVHPADTFLRDMLFFYRGDGLIEGSADFGGLLEVELERTSAD